MCVRSVRHDESLHRGYLEVRALLGRWWRDVTTWNGCTIVYSPAENGGCGGSLLTASSVLGKDAG